MAKSQEMVHSLLYFVEICANDHVLTLLAFQEIHLLGNMSCQQSNFVISFSSLAAGIPHKLVSQASDEWAFNPVSYKHSYHRSKSQRL